MVSRDRCRIEELVLGALTAHNEARVPGERLPVTRDAVLFGPGSPLDSLGLVSLLIDIEDALAREGLVVSLSDERAMSEARSPFSDVPSLVAHIEGTMNRNAAGLASRTPR